MKIETKRKLVRLFSKLIGYREYEEFSRPFIVQKWQVLHVRCQHLFNKEELNIISESEIKSLLQHELIKELDIVNAIKYTRRPDKYRKDETEIMAELRFVKADDKVR